MNHSEMRQALSEMKSTQNAADECANTAAQMVAGRLRHCQGWVVEQLKRELRDFNIQTRRWRKK